MKVGNVALLCAALLAPSTSAAVRREILNRHTPRHYYALTNTTISTSSFTKSTLVVATSTSTSELGTPLPSQDPLESGDNTVINDSISNPISLTRPLLHTSQLQSYSISISNRTSTKSSAINSPYTSQETFHSEAPSTARETALPAANSTTISSSTLSSKSHHEYSGSHVATAGCHGSKNGSRCTSSPWTTRTRPASIPGNYSVTAETTPLEMCTPVPFDGTIIEYSVIYTSTVTFYGNRSDYIAPFSALETPHYCPPTASPAPIPDAPPTHLPEGATISTSTSYGYKVPLQSSPTDSLPVFGNSPVPAPPEKESTSTSDFRHVITFITTDKNPSVVFPSDPPPNYSQTWVPKGPPPAGGGGRKTANSDHGVPVDLITQPPPTFRITAGPDRVTINDKTFTDLKPDETTIITVDRGTFTIFPTAVVGLGSTIVKPAPGRTDGSIPAPTTVTLGGLSLTLSDSVVVVGDMTLTIPPKRTTTVIGGKTVVLAPGTLIVNGETQTYPTVTPKPTDVFVTGGEMITAIGPSVVVIRATTVTYGLGIPETVKVIDEDTISILPSGVSVHGRMLGGPSAAPTDTTHEIVGGATIAKIPPSLVLINGVTFTIGPKAGWKTTVIGDETITIGPSGVVMSSMTMSYPFGASIVTTLYPSGTWVNNFPVKTGDSSDGDDNGVSSIHPDFRIGFTCFCIAMGVWVLF